MLSDKVKKNLIIGTASFQNGYGLTKKHNPSLKKQLEIIKYAQKNNINYIDTANAYEGVEKKLGKIGLRKFKLITKINLPNFSKIQKKNVIQKIIYDQVDRSLKNLKIKQFHCILLHAGEVLKTSNGKIIYECLLSLKFNKKTKKIGISIYDPIKTLPIIKKFDLDIIQVPFNLFDQRVLSKEFVKIVNKKKIEVHIRSIFLQGLLILEKNDRPKYFLKWKKLFKRFDEIKERNKISGTDLCIMNALFLKKIQKKIVLGINSKKQLEEILNIKLIKDFEIQKSLCSNSKELIYPYLWPKI
jgi:aryl-alcohol dehydrogenase-like predicted oxidoreductase